MKTLQVLSRLLHLKTVLLGVVPFHFHRSTLTLELRRELLLYCCAIVILGPTGRFYIYLTTFLRMHGKFIVAFYSALFIELSDVVLLIVPPCCLLYRHKQVKRLFVLLVKLYHNPAVSAFPFRRWFRTCLLFNLMYESAYGVNFLLNIFQPGSTFHLEIVNLLLSTALSQLSKSAVMLIMYGSGQYLQMALVQLKEHLLLGVHRSTGPVQQETLRQLHVRPAGWMQYYGQLWQVCEILNDLFGVPLITYCLMSLMHLTFICYVMLTKMMVEWHNFSVVQNVLAGVELMWTVFELLCLMRIVSTFARTREESLKTQKLLLRLNLSPMDHKLKQSIEVFALQTLHQPIEFTACRMFTLDYTVLFSIAAAVTNYLIILIQFEMAIEQ
ncbi:AGAP009256-PD [Anopheles gambiae str. PEST]|uniref:Gustatory receptor n=1 Tax=Anopheles gambiae TaxID=7165 RepID=Q7PVK1_ANOGA|nr:AGAP009256-PD [Anopheles gambiae str. PEST]